MRLNAINLPLESLHSEMDRVMKSAFPATKRGPGFEFDLFETETSYELVADLPGVRDEDLEISLENRVLSVKARRSKVERAEMRVHRLRRPLELEESIRFPIDINADGVTAELRHGELQLHLPKLESQLPKKIAVKRIEG